MACYSGKSGSTHRCKKKDELNFAEGYCKSMLDDIDSDHSMRDLMSQVTQFTGEELSAVDEGGVIISQNIAVLDKAYASQEKTLRRLMQDAFRMAKEQVVLHDLRCRIHIAKQRLQEFQGENLDIAQDNLTLIQVLQKNAILDQMEALGLSPQELMDLHQTRNPDAQQQIPSEASSHSQPCAPATKKAKLS